jgi:hypothetical protein
MMGAGISNLYKVLSLSELSETKGMPKKTVLDPDSLKPETLSIKIHHSITKLNWIMRTITQPASLSAKELVS